MLDNFNSRLDVGFYEGQPKSLEPTGLLYNMPGLPKAAHSGVSTLWAPRKDVPRGQLGCPCRDYGTASRRAE
jgi:hypothetical protein